MFGKIEDFVIDMETGRIAYAVLSFAGTIGPKWVSASGAAKFTRITGRRDPHGTRVGYLAIDLNHLGEVPGLPFGGRSYT
jgi:hypothetical protein